MRLPPRDFDKLALHQAGVLAQKRLARGLALRQPEAVALLATQLLELIRDGRPISEVTESGKRMLGLRQVEPGVEALVSEVQVEGTFPDGTKLVTVHDPIASEHGDLALALYGSFLPVPDVELFPRRAVAPVAAPGDVTVDGAAPPVALYAGRARVALDVLNTGDRPIQVGSHYPLEETNAALEFDRALAHGRHLAIAAGTSVRFEPGERKSVWIVDAGASPDAYALSPTDVAAASLERS